MATNPYNFPGWALNDLHSRARPFLDGTPQENILRINRLHFELEALWESPYVWALIVADNAIKALQATGICAWLTGAWENSYYAFLMDIVEQDPTTIGKDDVFIAKPIGICVPFGYQQQCLEQLLFAAQTYGFYLRKTDGHWLLLNVEENTNPNAPIIQIIER